MSDDIIVVPYDPAWPAQYQRLKQHVQQALGAQAAIEHIGSTSVPGLAAKPVIDILVGLPHLSLTDTQLAAMAAAGFTYKGENGIPGRRFFQAVPERIAHVHMVQIGDEIWEHHLVFRDYLRQHPAAVAAYASLKQELAAKYRQDRATYTDSKAPFITDLLARAKAWAAAASRS